MDDASIPSEQQGLKDGTEPATVKQRKTHNWKTVDSPVVTHAHRSLATNLAYGQFRYGFYCPYEPDPEIEVPFPGHDNVSPDEFAPLRTVLLKLHPLTL